MGIVWVFSSSDAGCRKYVTPLCHSIMRHFILHLLRLSFPPLTFPSCTLSDRLLRVTLSALSDLFRKKGAGDLRVARVESLCYNKINNFPAAGRHLRYILFISARNLQMLTLKSSALRVQGFLKPITTGCTK